MTEADRKAANLALMRWFKSQELSPLDAGLLMQDLLLVLFMCRHGAESSDQNGLLAVKSFANDLVAKSIILANKRAEKAK